MKMIIAALILGTAPAQAQATKPCAISVQDQSWIDGALASWRVAERRQLHLAPSALPSMTFFDARCRVTGIPNKKGQLAWSASAHQGQIELPDGSKMPVTPTSFAAPPTNTHEGYFVMGLPSVWRAAKVESKLGLERLMDGVMLHELMHTRQFYFVSPELASLTKRYGLPDDLTDDSLQDAFAKNSDYVAAYTAERDMFFAAASAPGIAQAKTLARRGFTMMKARQARYFTGTAEKWAPLDNVFLTMEGLGQWLAYAHYIDSKGSRLDPRFVLPDVRRGGAYWSQDEGLAIFLVIDRLVPGWQKQAFAPKPELVDGLLARAAG